jgi:hypothetical protein
MIILLTKIKFFAEKISWLYKMMSGLGSESTPRPRMTKFNPETRNRLMYYMNSGNENPNVFYYLQPNGEVEVISSDRPGGPQKLKITNSVKNITRIYQRVTPGFNARIRSFLKPAHPEGLNSEELAYDVANVFIYPAAFDYLSGSDASVNPQLQAFANYVKANPNTDARQAVRTAGIIEAEVPDTAGKSENTKGSNASVVMVDNLTTGPSGVDVTLQTAVETARKEEADQTRQQLQQEAVKQQAGEPVRTGFVQDTQHRIDLTVPTGEKLSRPDPATLPSGIAGDTVVQGIEMIENVPQLERNPLLPSDTESVITQVSSKASEVSSKASELSGTSATAMNMSMSEFELFDRLKRRIEQQQYDYGPNTRELRGRFYAMTPEEQNTVNKFLAKQEDLIGPFGAVTKAETVDELMFLERTRLFKDYETLKSEVASIYGKLSDKPVKTDAEQAMMGASLARESRRAPVSPSEPITQSSSSGSTISDLSKVNSSNQSFQTAEGSVSEPGSQLESVSQLGSSVYGGDVQSLPGSEPVQQQVTTSGQVGQPQAAATVAARNLNDGLLPKFHKEAIIVFFNSDTQPNWDPELEKNIVKADYEQSSALKVMKHIVDTEGASILVDKVITTSSSTKDDVIIELNEILQLHFSLHRNMSRGPRIPKVGISLASLVGSGAVGGTAVEQPAATGPETTTEENIAAANAPENTIVPGRIDNSGSETSEDSNLQPLTTVTNGVADTGINLSNEYLNSVHFLGANNHGPRFLDVKPRGMQIHPVSKIDRSGYIPSANVPGPMGSRGPQLAKIGAGLRTNIKLC